MAACVVQEMCETRKFEVERRYIALRDKWRRYHKIGLKLSASELSEMNTLATLFNSIRKGTKDGKNT